MERSKNMTRRRRKRSENEHTVIPVTIIAIFQIVGLIGLGVKYTRPTFLHLVPYHLLLMLALLLFSHKGRLAKAVLFMTLIFVIGFVAEWIGVNKGWLFGQYTYGNALGFKVGAVPLIIGVNWALLVYATGAAMQSQIKDEWVRIATGATVLVMLDVFIEQVAPRLNYWYWRDNNTPLINYICWFLLGSIMLFIFEKFDFRRQRSAGFVFLVLQFVFFIGLTLSLT